MASAKSKCLQLTDKAKIIEEVSQGAGVTQLSKKYGVSKSTICKIKRNKTQIMQRVCNTFQGSGTRRTLKNAKAPKMENSLYKWFVKQRENHVPVSGQMIKERARLFNEKLKETENFVASDGWLQKFKARYGIRLLVKTREKLSPQTELIQPFKNRLMSKIEELNLSMDQIYKADESALYWKLLPEKTLAAPIKKSVPERKPEKQRITFLASTNATGSHKIKPLVIGKAKNPRSFKNFNCPVDYDYSKTACTTSSIFLNWFQKSFVPQVTKFLKKEGLSIKALLLLDNAPSHPPEEQLRSKDGSIFTMYIPADSSLFIQSTDRNIIKLTKLYYRKFLLTSLLSKKPEKIPESLEKITLRDAVLNLHMAWNELNQKIIEKCWGNLFHKGEEDEDEDDTLVSTSSDVTNLLKLVNPIKIVCTPADIQVWNEDKQMDDEDEGSDDEDCITETNRTAVTDAQAIEIFNQALDWAERNEATCTDILVLRKLRSRAVENNAKCKLTQTKITSYFSVQ